MIDKSNLFQADITQDAEDSFITIYNLAKVGLAASDTAMAVDLTKGGFDALFEAIAAYAEDGMERWDAERKSMRSTP